MRVAYLGAAHTASYVLHLFTGYCLMLVFMMLNVWLCLALLLGAGAGFLLFHFRPVKSRLFRLLLSRDLTAESGDRGADDKSSDTEGTVGYEKIAEYRLKDCDSNGCPRKEEGSAVQ